MATALPERMSFSAALENEGKYLHTREPEPTEELGEDVQSDLHIGNGLK